MIKVDVDKFREIFTRAKLHAYITGSTNPEKEKLLEQLRSKMEEVMELVEKILEGEGGGST